MNWGRWIRGTALALLLVAGSIGLLAYTAYWAPEGTPRCVMAGHSVGWFGCVMAVHETLAGSLIIGAGALFAAWLAFSGLQAQIGMAERNEREARRLERQKNIQKAAEDLDLVMKAHGFIHAVVASFPTLDDPANVPAAFAARLLDLRRSGHLQLSANAERAPDGYGDSVKTVMT